MFNPLTPDQLIAALGAKLQDAGRGAEVQTTFEREQMLSAYSLSRHLRGELDAAGAFARFGERTAQLLTEAAATTDDAWAVALRGAAAIVASGDVRSSGEALADLLHDLRAADPPWAAPVITQLHHLLRELCEAEVAALAESLK